MAVKKLGKSDTQKMQKRVLEVVKLFNDTETSWQRVRLDQNEDMKFFAGEQFDDSIVNRVNTVSGQSNPYVRNNMLPNYVNQVENNIRQMNISMVVHATDEKGSEDVADVYAGLFRSIEHKSNAKSAYIKAAGKTGALVPGLGFLKVTTDYVSQSSFDQEILIKGISDPFKVLPDFYASQSDFSDANFWFEYEIYPKSSYDELYPQSQLAAGNLVQPVGEARKWTTQQEVKVVRYWYKKHKTKTLVRYADGTTGFVGEVIVPHVAASPSYQAAHLETYPDTEAPLTMEDQPEVSREVDVAEVCWLLTNGVEIIEEGEWHDSEFPWVAVAGYDYYVDGTRKIHGMIRFARDPQNMINFQTTQIAKRLGQANMAPWIADINTIPEPARKWWNQANVNPPSVLYYDGKNGGQAPQRGDTSQPEISSLLAGAAKSENDLKATIGMMYETQLTPREATDQSGIAIQTLAQRGELANLHFSDNLVQSMKRLGYLVMRLIPKIYDTERTIRIIGADNEPELIAINKVIKKNGEDKSIFLDSNDGYECVVDTGPSFASKKAEQSDAAMKFATVTPPEILPSFLDVIAANTDWSGGKLIAERIKLWQGANMPFLIDNEQMEDVPPAAKAMISKLMGQLQKSDAAVQELGQENQTLKMNENAKLISSAADERIATIKAITEIKLKSMELYKVQQQGADEKELTLLKLELEHMQKTKKIYLDHLKGIDKASGQKDSTLYSMLSE